MFTIKNEYFWSIFVNVLSVDLIDEIRETEWLEQDFYYYIICLCMCVSKTKEKDVELDNICWS